MTFRYLMIAAAVFLGACAASPEPDPDMTEWRLVIHGGAGVITRDGMTPEKEAAYTAALETALEAGAAVTAVIGETMSALSVADIVDLDEARKRLDKELAQLDKDIKSTEGKLSNEKFVSRAPVEIVEENRERIRDWTARREKLKAARKGLEGI